MLKDPKGSPLSVFRHCETFFRKFIPSPKGPPFNCDENVDNFGSGPRLATRFIFFAFSIFEYCKLTFGCPFAIFELWIWRQLGPVPACLVFASPSSIISDFFQSTRTGQNSSTHSTKFYAAELYHLGQGTEHGHIKANDPQKILQARTGTLFGNAKES